MVVLYEKYNDDEENIIYSLYNPMVDGMTDSTSSLYANTSIKTSIITNTNMTTMNTIRFKRTSIITETYYFGLFGHHQQQHENNQYDHDDFMKYYYYHQHQQIQRQKHHHFLLKPNTSPSLLFFRKHYYRHRNVVNTSQYGTCNGCYCVPSQTNHTCPMESIPDTLYNDTFIQTLKLFHWNNTLSLSCNPYDINNNADNEIICDTNEYSMINTISNNDINSTNTTTCCVVDFFHNNDTIHNNDNNVCSNTITNNISTATSYNTRTYYGSIEQATIQDNLYVTHEGQCGLCSNLHDLAIYMEWGTNLRSQTESCGVIGALFGKHAGIKCFHKRIGFTIGCSTIWYYNTVNTRNECHCWLFALSNNRIPTNGPSPQCNLNSCLQCDETQSGIIFKQYAGRIRRNSALLIDMVRNCSDIAKIKHVDPCQYINK